MKIPLRFTIPAIVVFLFQGTALGKDRIIPSNFRTEPIYQRLTIKEGLPSNIIYSIQQDREQLMWFSTEKGLVRFNGLSMRIYNEKEGLPVNDVYWNYIDKHNTIWPYDFSATIKYISRDSVYTFPARRFKTNWFPDIIAPFGNGIIQSYQNDFILLNNGVMKELTKRELLQQYFPWVSDTSCNLRFSEDYVTFLGTNYLGFLDIATKKWVRHNYGTAFDIREVKRAFIWKNYLLVTTQYNVKIRYELFSGKRDTIYPERHDLRNIGIEDGQLFLRTSTGMLQLNNRFTIVDSFNIPSSFSTSEADCLFRDRQENIWGSRLEEGIYMFPKVYHQYSRLSFGTTYRYKRFIVTADACYLFTREGAIHIWKKGSNHLIVLPNDTSHSLRKIRAIKTRNGILYTTDRSLLLIKTDGEVIDLIKDPDPLKLKELKLVNLSFKDAAYDQRENRLLNIASHNLIEIGLKGPAYRLKNYDFLGGRHLAVDTTGRIWISNDYGRISCIDKHYKVIKDTLFDCNITQLRGDIYGNMLFMVEGRGILMYHSQSGKSDWVVKRGDTRLMEFTDSALWVGCDGGVLRYRFEQGAYNLANTYPNYGQVLYSDLYDMDVQSDTLFLLGNAGIIQVPVQQKTYRDTGFSNSVYVQTIRLGNKWKTGLERFENTFQHGYTPSNITFGFTCIGISYLGDIHYQYYLEGQDKNWQSSNESYVTYPALEPGSYKLHVLAIVNNTIIRSKEFVLNIEILPAWWQSGLFKVSIFCLAFAGMGFLMWLILRYRSQKEKTAIELKKQIAELRLSALQAQMNPHFTFNVLGAVHSYIKTQKEEDAQELLVQFSHLIRMYLEFSRRRFISLEEEVAALKLYLEIEERRFGYRFSSHFDVTPDAASFLIPPMLLQPIIENAVNHGLYHKKNGQGLLEVFIFMREEKLHVVIMDNGIGREAAKKIQKKSFPSRATQIIEDRIEVLKKSEIALITLQTEDQYSKEGEATGTKVEITIKYK